VPDPLVAQLDGQVQVARRAGSSFYAVLLERMRADAQAGGPVRAALAGHEHDRVDEWDAFRLLAGVHRLVLSGEAPDLQRHYPSTGGDGDGPEASAVRFVDFFSGQGRPPLGAGIEVAERAGCDLNPVDPATEEGRLTLLACIFPDEAERFDLLERAIAVARETPVVVERADLASWASKRLAAPRPGLATVVYHTLVWPYLPDAVRERAEATLMAAGERASDEAPLALLAFEATREDPSRIEVHLTEWPGGERRLVARTGHHPVTVEWLL
jgi:hypothetical protein